MPKICMKCGKSLSTLSLSPPHTLPMKRRQEATVGFHEHKEQQHLDPIDAEIEREMRKMDEYIDNDIKKSSDELDMELKKDEQELDYEMSKWSTYQRMKDHPPDWDERFGLEPYYLRKMKRQMRGQGVPENEIHDTAMDKLMGAGAGFIGGLAVAGGKKLFEVGKKQIGTVAAPVKEEIKKEKEAIGEEVKKKETKLGTEIAEGLRQRIPIGGFAGVGKLSPAQAERKTQEEMLRSGIAKAEAAGLLATKKSEEVAKEQERFKKEQDTIRKRQSEEDRGLSSGISGLLR